jgi:hypothetical protein
LRVSAAGRPPAFFGWRVAWAAFAVAVFGWGVGFYGPPVFLHAVREARGWPVSLVSAAVTCHFLLGALAVANLAALHRRFGLVAVTRAGGAAAALGVLGWASAREPWQLFAATPLCAFGWAATGAAAINAMVSPWFDRRRPAALPGALLWRSPRFATLAAATSLGLFAQIGLIAHLFSLLVPALGAQPAGFAAGLATACAIAGRTGLGWLLPPDADRRRAAAANYALQFCGSLALAAAGGADVPTLLLGVVLFGLGLGNATSLPPLIAQRDFAPADTARAVALVTACSQAAYAFAPAAFGALRDAAPAVPIGAADGAAPALFLAAAGSQAAAAAVLLLGRRARRVLPAPAS